MDIKRVPELVPEEIARKSHFKLDQKAPVAKVVRTMNEVPTGFVLVLAAVRDQKEKQAA